MEFGNIENFTKEDSQELYIKIGENVARIRNEHNLSQLQLSLMMGYKSPSQIAGSEICYKNYRFNIEQLLKLSIIFKVDICEFFK